MNKVFEDGQTFQSTEEMVVVLADVVRTQAAWINKIAVAISADEQGEEVKATEKLKDLADALHDKLVQDITILSMERALDE